MYGIMHVYRTMCTPLLYIVAPGGSSPVRFENALVEGREVRASLAPPILSLRHTTFFRPSLVLSSLFLSPSLFPLARASCSSPANPLRHALACVNHAYRFSFVRASEGRSVVAHVWSLFPPSSLFLFFTPHSLLFDRKPGGRAMPQMNSLLETHTRAWYPILLVTMAVASYFPSVPLAPSLSLPFFCRLRPFPRVSLFQHSCRAKPSTLSPLTIFALLPPPYPHGVALHPSEISGKRAEIWKLDTKYFILYRI